jgi:segregation and condensation protein B
MSIIDEGFDDGRARNFDELDVRETQAALAEEMEAMIDEEEADQAAMIEDESLEQDASDAVWSAAQMADHLRMAEALLFAAVEPLDEEAIAARLPAGADVRTLIDTLVLQYENRGVVLSKAAGKYRFVTASDVAYVLEKEKIEPRKLTRAALETLAIIAYHQPCTRADIEDVRGVAVSPGSLDQLMEIGWVRLRGRRRSAPGRPILYGTTQVFLEHFNLENVGDLPGMADLKAAGLLDARLPPGFTVPAPSDDVEGEDIEELGEDAEFVTDFHEEDQAD